MTEGAKPYHHHPIQIDYLCILAMKKKYNAFIICLFTSVWAMAQPALGQNPATLKAADFTDAQILDLLNQAQAAG